MQLVATQSMALGALAARSAAPLAVRRAAAVLSHPARAVSVRCASSSDDKPGDKKTTFDSDASSGFKGFGKKPQKFASAEKLNADDQLRQSLGAISSSAGRNPGTTNVVMGGEGNESMDKWNELDEKVNEYPCQRVFTAIGTGGDDFRDAMVGKVQAVFGTVHPESVVVRPSKNGKYVSVKVGPMYVENRDQVVAVYGSMKEDDRLQWFI